MVESCEPIRCIRIGVSEIFFWGRMAQSGPALRNYFWVWNDGACVVNRVVWWLWCSAMKVLWKL